MQSIVMHVTTAASLSGKQGKSMGRLVRCPGGGSEKLPIGREILKPRYYSQAVAGTVTFSEVTGRRE